MREYILTFLGGASFGAILAVFIMAAINLSAERKEKKKHE